MNKYSKLVGYYPLFKYKESKHIVSKEEFINRITKIDFDKIQISETQSSSTIYE